MSKAVFVGSVSSAIVVADQVTKWMVRSELPLHDGIPAEDALHRGPHPAPVEEQDRADCAELDRDLERARRPVEEARGHDQVAGAADREELGHPLDQPHDDAEPPVRRRRGGPCIPDPGPEAHNTESGATQAMPNAWATPSLVTLPASTLAATSSLPTR